MTKQDNEKLTKADIEKLTGKFLSKQEIRFSKVWKKDLVKRLAVYEGTNRKLNIEGTHNEKFFGMFAECGKLLKSMSQYQNTNWDVIEDSVSNAYLKWLKSPKGFDESKAKGAKNPELNYLKNIAENELIARFNKDNPKTNDTTRATTVALEADTKSEDNLHKKIENEENLGTVEIGRTRYASIAAQEIYRVFLLKTDCFEPTSRKRTKPEVSPAFEHDKKALVSIYKNHIKDPFQFDLLKDSSATDYAVKRWEILRAADTRRWMELAVSELRKSAKKKQAHLLELGLDEKVGGLELAISYAKKSKEDTRFLKNLTNGDEIIKLIETPVLSCVALDENGNLIETCYKGEIEEETIIGTWAKHCEFSLFTEKIGEKNKDSLKGGTLYTTLEPCNKRGTYFEEGVEKPKLPCAVRCLESGIKNICIGLDYNKKVFEKGLQILETGEYTFELAKGEHKGDDKEKNAARLLEKYLEEKYDLIRSTKTERAYKISEGVNYSCFDLDLLQEVKELNALFLTSHQDKHEKEFFNLQ